MHLRQPGTAYSAYGLFTKNKERKQTFKETTDSRYIYQSELGKAYFRHDMIYESFKDLSRRTTSDKVFHDKAFNFSKNPKYDCFQRGLVSIV